MDPRTPDPAVAALERVVIASVAATTIAVAAAAPELTLSQWRVLVLLADAPAGMPVTELAAAVGSRVPAASRLLSRMRRRGLVAMAADASDGRVHEVVLGQAGREVWERVVERRREALEGVVAVARLGAADAATLDRLAAAFEARR